MVRRKRRRGLYATRYISMMGLPAWSGGVRYTLCDDFTGDLAAGSVNATPAVPGPGTRTVVDTNNIMSIAGGVLVVNGTPAASDRYVLDGVARAAGRVLVAKFPTFTTVTAYDVRVSWNVDTTTNISCAPGFFIASPTSLTVGEGAGIPYSVTVSPPVTVALVLQAVGGYEFALLSGVWTLLWQHAALNNATMYPKLFLRNANPMVFTFDNFRVPQALWLPTPLAYDTFTRANGALGNSEATGPDGQTTTARAWAADIGTVAVSSNTAICSALAGGIGAATVNTGEPDVFIDVKLTRGTATAGLILRYVDADNYLTLVHNGTNLQLVKRVAGSNTTLIDAAATYGAESIIRVILSGTTAKAFYGVAGNIAKIGADQTVPASSSGKHGLYFTDTDSTLNDFTVMPYAGTYHSGLNRFTV